jgi:SH3-like domain-containing protein
MESYVKIAVIVLVLSISPVVYSEQTDANASASATVTVTGPNELNLPAMPFLAEITSDDVYVRSGPGTNYYPCGKLNKGDKVKVVASKFSWLQITPPGGSYCWISKQYVETDPQNGTVGKVIGDAVRVYAGSDEVQPMHSATILVKLSNGDKVSLLGEVKEDYYKIAPPEGAYLWVSNQYTRALGSLMLPAQPTQLTSGTPPVAVAPFPTPAEASKLQAPAPAPNEPPGGTPAPAPLSIDDQKMGEVRLLKERVEAEKAKPIDQQDFTEMKKSLEEIAKNKQTPRAARGAQALLKTIERCELAREVAKADKLQEQQFGQTQQRIETAHSEQLAKFEDLSVFAVIGQLKESTLFAETPGVKYYRIVDSEDKTICYAKPTGAAVDMDMSKFIDRKVGLVGTIEPNHELGGALVEFTNIVELK